MMNAAFPVVALEKVAMVKGGKRLPKGRVVQDAPTLHPYIRVVDFGDDGLNLENIKYIDEETFAKISRYTITDQDVYISIAGTIGRVGVVPKHLSGANLTENAAKICISEPSIDRRFLVYYLRSFAGKGQIDSKTVGTSQPKLALFRIGELMVPCPPLPTQQKITAILSAYDDLIENNTRRIKILEEMAQMIYREWFVNFRFPGHEKVKLVDSPLGKIPEGWEVVRVGDILDKVERRSKIQKQDYDQEGPIPVIDQGKQFIGGYTNEGSALISVGLPMIVFGDHTRVLKFIDFPFACGADGTQLLRANDDRMPTTLFYCVLTAIDLGDFAYARHFKFLKEELIALPSNSIAARFDSFAKLLYEQKKLLMTQNRNLRNTRDLLLPKLMSGEVDVSELDIPPESLAS